MRKTTGGAAFSRAGSERKSDYGDPITSLPQDGMSMRDYFAAKSMQAIVRRYDGLPFGGCPDSPQYKELAEDAYSIADAMLEARNK